jgi:hypothetical protein
MNIAGIVLDLSTFFIYFIDSQTILWDYLHILTMMEVENIAEVSPAFTKHNSNVLFQAVRASQLIALAASKLFVPLLFLLVFGLFSIKTMWEVIAENKRIRSYLHRV